MQESLLARGPNFAIVPKSPLKKLTLQWWKRPVPDSHPRRRMNLRSDNSDILKNHCPHTKPNLTMEECRALKQLKEETSWVVLIADKGVAMVIMDKQDYTNKALSFLSDTSTYKILNKDPTNRLKNKLIQTLKDIKQAGGLCDQKYRKIVPYKCCPSQVLCFPKIHKVGTPIRPIVSSRDPEVQEIVPYKCCPSQVLWLP